MTISITCPHGFGETSRARCLDRATPPRPVRKCRACLIPARLIAWGGVDPVNRRLSAGLAGLISCPWTPPARPVVAPVAVPAAVKQPAAPVARTPQPTRLTRHHALALALAMVMARRSDLDVPEKALEAAYRKVKGAPALVCGIMRVVRQAGLPVERRSPSRLVVPVNNHVRAYVRGYVKEAA